MRFRDPPRLSDVGQGPDELRSLLRHAQDDVLPAMGVEQLVRAVESGTVTPSDSVSAPSQSGAEAPASATGLGRLAAIGAAGTTAVAIGIGVWLFGSTNRAKPIDSRSPASATARSSAGENQVPSPSADAALRSREDRETAALASGEAVPAPASEEVTTAPTSHQESIGPDFGSAASGDRDLPSSAPRSSAKDPTSVDELGPTPVRSGESAQVDEYALLRSARQAIATNPSLALSLTNEHIRRFPKGMLGQEREAIAIEALVRLGRRQEARARAEQFVRAHPDSPYAQRIERSTHLGSTP